MLLLLIMISLSSLNRQSYSFFMRTPNNLLKIVGDYSTIMDINYKDVSSWVQEYIFQGLSTPLSGFKYNSFGVREGIFLTVATRLSRPAEPSR